MGIKRLPHLHTLTLKLFMQRNKLAPKFKKITLSSILFLQIILFSSFCYTMINIPISQANHRRVLLFAPTAKNPHLLKQQTILQSNEAGMKERDLLVSSIIYSPDKKSSFDRYNVSATAFTLILIGKDGTEKMRRSSPVFLDELYQLIDGMPMRKIEMKKARNP